MRFGHTTACERDQNQKIPDIYEVTKKPPLPCGCLDTTPSLGNAGP